MTPRPPRRGSRRNGFVLVGVIMFVLALTTIGLALFSISGYEAQFLQRSLDGEQAFQSAVGGLERAKYVLCATSRLESPGESLPLEDVVSATAVQVQNGDSLSNGTVQWLPSNPIYLRVTARVNGQERMVEGRFAPELTQNYYRQLVTVRDSLRVFPIDWTMHMDRDQTVTLNGPVWNTSGQDPMDWEQWLRQPWPNPVLDRPPVPLPDADNFILQHAGPIGPQITDVGTHRTYTLDTHGASSPVYFTWDDPANTSWSLQDTRPTGDVNIVVNGCAVWLLPRGVTFWHPPAITGVSGMDCLVIVAGRQGPDPDPLVDRSQTPGILFEGGLTSNIPLILVTSGEAIIWRNYDYLSSAPTTVVYDLSIFAGSAAFMGPVAGGLSRVDLDHPANGLLNSHFVDLLLQYGALPNAGSSLGHNLDLVSGTWHASAP